MKINLKFYFIYFLEYINAFNINLKPIKPINPTYPIKPIKSINYLNSGKIKLKMNIENSNKILTNLRKSELGEPWTIHDFQEKLNQGIIEGGSIIVKNNKNQGFVAIDKEYEKTLSSLKLHTITTGLPELNNIIITELQKYKVNYDTFILNRGIFEGLPFNFEGLILTFIIFNTLRSLALQGRIDLPFKNNILNSNNFELTQNEDIKTRFSDIAGCDEVKYELEEIVEFFKNPTKFTDFGAKIPKGILLEGPPGSGKTLLARSIAGEANIQFIPTSGSSFIEMFVGLGAKRVRYLFNLAKANKPCIIFIDGIDAIGMQRELSSNNIENEEREQTLNELLNNMDGFDKEDGIIVLAATNRVDILDSALVRPGRFDRKIKVGLPDKEGRRALLLLNLKNKKYEKNINLEELVLLTCGFSGADIENLINEAAILTIRNKLKEINNKMIYLAYEKNTVGLPKQNDYRSYELKDLIACHEAGHTVVAKLFKEFFEVRRVTINANNGGVGGFTLFTPKNESNEIPSKKFLLANLIITLGGRAAEIIRCRDDCLLYYDNYDNEKLFGNFTDLGITTGAFSDLQKADNIARNYINIFGLSENIDLMGNEIKSSLNSKSEYSREKIDKGVELLIQFALDKAIEIIELNIDSFNEIVKLLLEKRTIGLEELSEIDINFY